MQRVLVVDDETIVGDVLQRYLTRLGYETEVSESASSAMERFEMDCFDLVMMDVHLAEHCGFDIARRMLRTRPSQKIVIISGLDRDSVIQRSHREDVSVADILIKPFALDTVKTIVSTVLCDVGAGVGIGNPLLNA